jgi:hypothetical protein
MRGVLLRHRFDAGIFRRRSEPAPRRPQFQRAELPFSPQCCRVSIRAGRTRRPRMLQRRPTAPHIAGFTPGWIFISSPWFARREILRFQISLATLGRGERAKIDSETTQTTLARLNCRISVTVPA